MAGQYAHMFTYHFAYSILIARFHTALTIVVHVSCYVSCVCVCVSSSTEAIQAAYAAKLPRESRDVVGGG